MSDSSSSSTGTTPTGFQHLGWSDGGVGSVLGFNVIVTVALSIIYSYLQHVKANKPLYQPRADPDNPTSKPVLKGAEEQCPKPLTGWFDWIIAAFKVTDDQILARSGLEALLYLRLQRMAIGLLVFVSLFSAVILIPVNRSGDNNVKVARSAKTSYTTGFNEWTVTNIEQGSDKLWAHLIVFVLITLFFYKTYGDMTKELARRREQFHHLKRFDRSVVAHTVMILNLPLGLRDPNILRKHIEAHMFPGSVVTVDICFHLPRLLSLMGKCKEAEKQLLHYHNLWAKIQREKKGAERKRPHIKVDASCSWCSCCCGTEVDAIEHHQAEVNRLAALLEVERQKDKYPTTGQAFVTFNSYVTARRMVQNFFFKHASTRIDAPTAPIYTSTLNKIGDTVMNVDQLSLGLAQKGLHAAQKHISGHPDESPAAGPKLPATRWIVKRAPHPDDLIWQNLNIPKRQRQLRWLLVTAATWWLVLFWTIPIVFLGSLNNLAEIPLVGSAFRKILDFPPWFVSFLAAYLPTLVVLLFNTFLPDLLRQFARWEGIRYNSRIEAKLMQSVFLFTFFATLVLPSVLLGGLAQANILAEEIINSPFSQIMALLAKISSPDAGFFISLLIQTAFMGTALERLRIGPYLVRRVKMKLAVTQDEIDDANHVEPFLFSIQYPLVLLCLTVTMFFSITMPLTTVFGLMVFLMKYAADRHNIAYVHPAAPETGGQLFAHAIRYLVLIQACFQLGMCGMFGGKEVVPQFIIAVIFFGYTCYSYAWYSKTIKKIFKQDEWIPDLVDQRPPTDAEMKGHDEDDAYEAPPLLVAPNPGDAATPKTEGLLTMAEKAGELKKQNTHERLRAISVSHQRHRNVRSSSLSFEDAYQHPALKWQQERYASTPMGVGSLTIDGAPVVIVNNDETVDEAKAKAIGKAATTQAIATASAIGPEAAIAAAEEEKQKVKDGGDPSIGATVAKLVRSPTSRPSSRPSSPRNLSTAPQQQQQQQQSNSSQATTSSESSTESKSSSPPTVPSPLSMPRFPVTPEASAANNESKTAAIAAASVAPAPATVAPSVPKPMTHSASLDLNAEPVIDTPSPRSRMGQPLLCPSSATHATTRRPSQPQQ